MKEDNIDNLIWHEMVQARSWEQYISEYTGRRLDRKKQYSILAIIFAIAGGSTWGLWKVLNVEWVTPLMFGLMGVSQVLSAIQKDIVVDADTLDKLSKLRGMYISYFNNLQKLQLQVEDDRLSKDEKENHFFALREATIPMQSLKDIINIRDIKKLNKKVVKRVEVFLASTHLCPGSNKNQSEVTDEVGNLIVKDNNISNKNTDDRNN